MSPMHLELNEEQIARLRKGAELVAEGHTPFGVAFYHEVADYPDGPAVLAMLDEIDRLRATPPVDAPAPDGQNCQWWSAHVAQAETAWLTREAALLAERDGLAELVRRVHSALRIVGGVDAPLGLLGDLRVTDPASAALLRRTLDEAGSDDV